MPLRYVRVFPEEGGFPEGDGGSRRGRLRAGHGGPFHFAGAVCYHLDSPLISDFCRFYLEGMPQALAERNQRLVWNGEPSTSPARETNAAERVYVAIDLETTGLDAASDSIIEIGAVRFQGGRELERFDQLIKPPKSIPPRITQITGIRNSDVAGMPTIEQVRAELLAFVGGDVAGVIGHSASFDIGFLKAAGIDFHRPVYDTLELSQILLPGRASYSLGELCLTLGIEETPNHRALQDALATAELFRRLQQQARSLPPTIHEILLANTQAAEGWAYTQFFADTAAAGGGELGALARRRRAGAPCRRRRLPNFHRWARGVLPFTPCRRRNCSATLRTTGRWRVCWGAGTSGGRARWRWRRRCCTPLIPATTS